MYGVCFGAADEALTIAAAYAPSHQPCLVPGKIYILYIIVDYLYIYIDKYISHITQKNELKILSHKNNNKNLNPPRRLTSRSPFYSPIESRDAADESKKNFTLFGPTPSTPHPEFHCKS